MLVGHVGYPIIGIDVGDAKDVQSVYAQPDALVFLLISQIAHANVSTLVGWCAELLILQSSVGCSEGQSVSIGQSECHLPAFSTWEVVGEVQVDAPSLVGRHWNTYPVDFLTCRHDAEGEP